MPYFAHLKQALLNPSEDSREIGVCAWCPSNGLELGSSYEQILDGMKMLSYKDARGLGGETPQDYIVTQ